VPFSKNASYPIATQQPFPTSPRIFRRTGLNRILWNPSYSQSLNLSLTDLSKNDRCIALLLRPMILFARTLSVKNVIRRGVPAFLVTNRSRLLAWASAALLRTIPSDHAYLISVVSISKTRVNGIVISSGPVPKMLPAAVP